MGSLLCGSLFNMPLIHMVRYRNVYHTEGPLWHLFYYVIKDHARIQNLNRICTQLPQYVRKKSKLTLCFFQIFVHLKNSWWEIFYDTQTFSIQYYIFNHKDKFNKQKTYKYPFKYEPHQYPKCNVCCLI